MEPDRIQIKLDPRYTADLLEVLKTNYSIPSACFSHPLTAAQLLRGKNKSLITPSDGEFEVNGEPLQTAGGSINGYNYFRD